MIRATIRDYRAEFGTAVMGGLLALAVFALVVLLGGMTCG